jgi:hypothetical protein
MTKLPDKSDSQDTTSVDTQDTSEETLQQPTNQSTGEDYQSETTSSIEAYSEEEQSQNNSQKTSFADRMIVTVREQSKLQLVVNIGLIIALLSSTLLFVTDAGIYIDQQSEQIYITTPVAESELVSDQQVVYMTEDLQPTTGTIESVQNTTIILKNNSSIIEKGAVRGIPLVQIPLY